MNTSDTEAWLFRDNWIHAIVAHDDVIKWKHFLRYWPLMEDRWIPLTKPVFTQPFVQPQINENIKAPCHWPLWGESTGARWIHYTHIHTHKGSVTREMQYSFVYVCWATPPRLTLRDKSISSTEVKFTCQGMAYTWRTTFTKYCLPSSTVCDWAMYLMGWKFTFASNICI